MPAYFKYIIHKELLSTNKKKCILAHWTIPMRDICRAHQTHPGYGTSPPSAGPSPIQ